METGPSAVPTPRFEWERLVRRIVMPGPHKLMAFVMASYADADGSRVRPGNDVLAAVTDQSEKNVRRIVTALRELGLLRVAARGGGRGGKGKATEYQLTIPTDLLDRAEVLTPGERPVSPDIQMSAQNDQPPLDNPESPDTEMSAQLADVISIDRTSDTVTERMTGHFQRMTGHPDVRLPTTYTNHLDHNSYPTPNATTDRAKPRARAPTDHQPPSTADPPTTEVS